MGDACKNLIDGKWVEAATGSAFDDISPFNKTDVLASFPRSDHRDIDRAVETARAYFPTWSRCPAVRRTEILFAAAHIIDQRFDELATTLVRDTGMVLAEAQTEVRDAFSILRAIAGDLPACTPETSRVVRPGTIVLATPTPLGVAGVIGHWTFPFAGCVWAVASALAAGDTVVVKPAEDAPFAALRVVEILLEAGLPPASICLVHGQGEEAGAPLVRHPDVAVVAFAGSPEVGREVAIACAAEQKHVCLDLGQRCIAIVLDGADLDLAAESIVETGLAVAGQRWRGAARLFVHRKVAKEFSDRVVGRVETLRLGDGMLAATDMGPVINEAQVKRVHGHTRMGLRDGAKLLCGGEAVKEGECKRGCYYAPTVFGEAALKMRFVQDETRGPTLTLLSVASLEDAIDQANAFRHDATIALHAGDIVRGLRAFDGLRASRVYVNPAPAGRGASSSVAGFGPPRLIRQTGSRRLVDFSAPKDVVIETAGPPA